MGGLLLSLGARHIFPRVLFYQDLLKILLFIECRRVFFQKNSKLSADSEGEHLHCQALAQALSQLPAEAQGRWPALL